MRPRFACARAALAAFAAVMATATSASADTVPVRLPKPDCYVQALPPSHGHHGGRTYNKCTGLQVNRLTPLSAPHLARGPIWGGTNGFVGRSGFRR